MRAAHRHPPPHGKLISIAVKGLLPGKELVSAPGATETSSAIASDVCFRAAAKLAYSAGMGANLPLLPR
jgi:hypothetical protein